MRTIAVVHVQKRESTVYLVKTNNEVESFEGDYGGDDDLEELAESDENIAKLMSLINFLEICHCPGDRLVVQDITDNPVKEWV